MRTDPIADTLSFLMASQGDQVALGPWRWLVMALLAALLLGALLTAAYEWTADPAQRTGRDVGLFAARVGVGLMWFQNLFWKLPVSTSNGLHYWTEQETKDAAFAVHAHLLEALALPSPNFLALNVAVLAIEFGFAVSLILGLGVRLMGSLGVLFVAQLWLGLYRNPQEWPWSYVFLMMLMGLFALLAAGRSLGLDATLRRTHPPDMTKGTLGTLVLVAT